MSNLSATTSSAPYTVLATDFLDNIAIEGPIFEGVAKVALAQKWREEDLEPYLAEADALLLFHDIPLISEFTFSRAPKCKAVVRAGVGYNNVDLAAAGKHGVAVCNVPDYGTEEVADHAMMMLLAIVRQLMPSDKDIRNGRWNFDSAIKTPRLRGKTLGVIGCGRIGTAMVLRAKAFGLDVVFYDPNIPPGIEKALGVRREYTLDPLLEQSHYVSLHCYLDPGSYHIIDERALSKMRPGSILVNTARGGCVDTEALVQALESGHLMGAGIDVIEREPLDDERLRNHPNVLLTPHSAFYSQEGYIELRSKAAEEVRRVLVGEKPRNLVNRAFVQNPRFTM